MTEFQAGLRRLLAPRHVAVYGGRAAAVVVRECQRIGYAGAIWPVHPEKREIGGLPCFASAEALPEPPDAAFLALPAEANIDAVAALARRGAGGVVCYASGFAEEGAAGAALQRRLVAAAGEMPVVGPNCYGVLNLLDGCALWPDVHGGRRVERGVAILTQSGNIALNLTMHRRGLPLALVIALGNKAVGSHGDYIEALLDDPRVTAIGLHCEGLDDVAAFSRAASRALEKRVPIVAMKTGRSELGAGLAMSHTSSLAGPDRLYDALFARHGVARVAELEDFVETLKLLHAFGPLPGRRLTSTSCSGGEAALVADLAEDFGLELPPFPPQRRAALEARLGPKVSVANPLDYHTYIWGDAEASEAVFTEVQRADADVHLLLLDTPRDDRGLTPDAGFEVARASWLKAHAATGARAALVASLPENLAEADALSLLDAGVAPMQGLSACLGAIGRAADFGAALARAPSLPLAAASPHSSLPARLVPEARGKAALARFGLAIPRGSEVPAAEAADAAERIGFPVAVKISSGALAHKSDVGGVALGLGDRASVEQAVRAMAGLGDRFLIEAMAPPPVAELILGLVRDESFGFTLTIGSGGLLVELIEDSVTLLTPVRDEEIERALRSLRGFRLLQGYRGKPAGDVAAVASAARALLTFAEAYSEAVEEIEINPLFVHAEGAVAVDVLMRLREG